MPWNLRLILALITVIGFSVAPAERNIVIWHSEKPSDPRVMRDICRTIPRNITPTGLQRLSDPQSAIYRLRQACGEYWPADGL
jgi:hypothetical protein